MKSTALPPAINSALTLMILGASLLLTGCANVIRSDVSRFHDWPAGWPADSSAQSFVFEVPAAKEGANSLENSIEYQQYQDQLRSQLQQIGIKEAAPGSNPSLKVRMQYGATAVATQTVVDPFGYSYGYGLSAYSYPYWYRSRWYPYAHHRYYVRGYGYYYDPFFFRPLHVDQRTQFARKLTIDITRIADGKKLYEATVDNLSYSNAPAKVLPAMIQSAFVNFPGKSGETSSVDIERKK